MATTVGYTVTVDDGVITLDCSHCGRLAAAAADDSGRVTVRGTMSVHASLHLTQLDKLGELLTVEQTRTLLSHTRPVFT